MLLARFSVLGSFIRPDPVQTHHGMTLNRDFSGQALRDDALFLLQVAGVLQARI